MNINFNVSTFLLGVITTFLIILGVFVFQIIIKLDRLETQLSTQSTNLTELKSLSMFERDRRKITGQQTTSETILDKVIPDKVIPDVITENIPQIIEVNTEAWAKLRRGMTDNDVEKLIGPNYVMRSDVRSTSYKYSYGNKVGFVYFDRHMKVINWDEPAYVEDANASPN